MAGDPRLSAAPLFARPESLLEAGMRAAIAGLDHPSEIRTGYIPWRQTARPNQIAPAGDWWLWLVLAGRGFGKTRTGAEWVHENVDHYGRWHFVAPTASDARDTMVEGESGILATAPPGKRPIYEPSKRRLTWPNGATALLFSAEEPERLRGPQCEAFWADEVAAWKYLRDTWDQLMFGFRLGAHPRGVATTTPKPLQLIKELLSMEGVAKTHGSTYENRDNLSPVFFQQIIARYEGTRLGRQELNAEVLEDVEGALWSYAMIEAGRVEAHPPLQRVVIPIDPAVTAGEDSDETGMVPCGVGMCNCKGEPELHLFVLEDLSGRYSPDGWAKRAVAAYNTHRADRIIGEANNGGDLVEVNIRTVSRNVSYKKVHASRGKRTRAEPVAALYEQGKVHHVGSFPQLEDQMTTYVPALSSQSPDRLDSLVWGATELMLGGGGLPWFAAA
jgi:phage terminase large subunit-like protein